MLGLDFGTTNSAVARAEPGGPARLATFELDGHRTATFRSVLYFSPERATYGQKPTALAGPAALTAYREAGGDAGGRFMQSLKSFLASRHFERTSVFGWPLTLEELVSLMLRGLRAAAMAQLDAAGDAVLIGRPVHFVVDAAGDVDPARDAAALARLTAAAELAGFTRVAFAYEPVAAAYEYERALDHDELVLIGDFGGGTSDFCLVRLGPGARRAGDRAETILAVDGVPLAGNAFDARLVRAVVSPALGLGCKRRSEGGQELPIPSWIYSRLERWEDLSLLATPETLDTLRRLRQQAVEPERIANLIHLVRHDLGYALYQEVERCKLGLSTAPQVAFSFDELSDPLAATITRAAFESWIDVDLMRIAACVDRLLLRCGVPASAVDRVFLTGGSSLVPSVRAIFAARFGADRVRGGDELITVARGLALIAAES
ncbi:Hsp70 family protein [bacterium]|nr:Hsp70 family protein [bacterium]